MEHEIVVKNTLAFHFPGNAAQPTLTDMGRFIKTLRGDRSMLHTAYKISGEKAVFIRFKSEEAMQFSLESNNTTLPFHYTDGTKVTVRMSVAGGNTRYVRIFDLPPEVTDTDLSSVLENYGTIKRIVWERFPADIGLDIFSGIRGFYMDIQKEIPETLHFRGRKGRIFYDGLKLKCFVCKSDAHLKKECPVFKERYVEKADHQPAEQENEPKSSARRIDEGTDEAAAPVAQMVGKRKHQKSRSTETKRQHCNDSDRNSQPQQKTKTIQPDCDNRGDGSTAKIPDDGQLNPIDVDSESESDLESIDWATASFEVQQAWIGKNNRKNQRINRKLDRLLNRQRSATEAIPCRFT